SLQPLPPHQRCHRARSPPRTKTSSRFGPQAATAGSEVRIPPSCSQPPQEPPSNQACQRPLSVPRPKTSRRPCDQDAAAGADVSVPPRLRNTAGGAVELTQPPAALLQRGW